ncbi:MAG: M20/M25/M40 family metallo-hydrolase [Lentisphaeria bacterium]|nr:M20/M25/M40 family metallo-hydrolase [Lentisphaeria bacterium]
MKSEYLDLLKSLIACRPITADIAAVNRASALLETFLLSHDVRVVREEINGRNTLYASCLPEGKESAVLFNAHLDVVPLSTPDQGIPLEKDGLLYGRGAGDCLNHVVCIAQILVENPGRSAAAIFTTDEEGGGRTTAEMLERGYKASKGAVILDTWSRNAIGTAEKGVLHIDLTAHGRSGHTAMPWLADNALDRLVKSYAKLLDAWQQPTGDDNWKDSLAATGVDTFPPASNVIPETATMHLNIRYVDPDSKEKIVRKIQEITGLEDVVIKSSCVPVFCDESSAFLQELKAIASRISGSEISFFRMDGATDARHIALKYPELPIIIDGMRHGNIHSAGEWLDLSDYDRALSIYSEFVKAL